MLYIAATVLVNIVILNLVKGEKVNIKEILHEFPFKLSGIHSL